MLARTTRHTKNGASSSLLLSREGGWFFIIPIYYFFFFLPSTFVLTLVVNCRAIVYDPASLFLLLALPSRPRGSHLRAKTLRPQLQHTRSCQYLTFFSDQPTESYIKHLPVEYKVHGARNPPPSSISHVDAAHHVVSGVHRWPKDQLRHNHAKSSKIKVNKDLLHTHRIEVIV